MEIIKGIPVNRGMAAGRIIKFSSDPFRKETLLQKLSREFHDLQFRDISRIKILRDNLYEKTTVRINIETEIKSFKQVLKKSKRELIATRKKLSQGINKKFSEIIDFQILALRDTNIYKRTIDLITDYGISSYLAVSIIFNERIELLRKNNKNKLKNRTYDLVDLYNRLVSGLIPAGLVENKFESGEQEDGLILVARKMYPTDLALIDLKKIKGIVIERQNIESHTSILIKSLHIPYIIKIDMPADDIKNGQTAILDGYNGKLILQPDKASLKKFLQSQKLESTKKPGKIKKNKKIPTLLATVNTMEEARSAAEMNVEGIGLFRSELSFLNGDIGLSLIKQSNAYREILELFPDRPVILRTLDLSGDKASFLSLMHKRPLAENDKKPLARKLCKRQLEALVRSSGCGSLIIAFPMVSRPEDMTMLKEQIMEITKRLGRTRKAIKRDIPLCAFIETPAAVFALEEILDECNYINIGTNDLLSLVYARSRQLVRTSNSKDFLQPPTIEILSSIIDRAHKKCKKVTLCGGIAANPKFLPILVGMRVDNISVDLKRYARVKSLLYELDPERCRRLVLRLEKLRTKKDIIRELCSFGVSNT